MLTVAIVISRTPLRYPFQWMETFFHELSHGLACVLTFGRIHRIEISFNGAGLCSTYGGWRIPILLAGYAGAVSWGAVIYLAGWSLSTSEDVFLLHFLMGVLIVSGLFWVRNPKTLLIIMIMIFIFWVPTLLPDTKIPAYAIEFYGIYVVQSAISAPLALIDGKHVGDGADLADITLIFPEGVWIALWFIYALIVTFWLWQITIPASERFTDYITWLPLLS
jgi:hypothetical protein